MQYVLSVTVMRVGWKFIGWLWCNGRIWTKCGLFFDVVSSVVHTLLPSSSAWIPAWYRSSYPDPHSWIADIGLTLLPIRLFGTEDSQMVPNQESNGGWSTSWKPQSRTAAIATTDFICRIGEYDCLGEAGLPSSVFPAVFGISLVLLFKVLNYFSSVGLSGRKQYTKC